MITAPSHKRGDSFSFTAVWTDTDPDYDFSGTTARAQAKKVSGEEVQDFLCEIELEPGIVRVTISATYSETSEWPIGPLRTDVELTLGTRRWSTGTIEIPVVLDVTRDA